MSRDSLEASLHSLYREVLFLRGNFDLLAVYNALMARYNCPIRFHEGHTEGLRLSAIDSIVTRCGMTDIECFYARKVWILRKCLTCDINGIKITEENEFSSVIDLVQFILRNPS
jgi:hypothetical protein